MFQIRQLIKMLLQNVFLPVVYAWYARKPVRKGSVIFADAHHGEMPFAMRRVYEALACDGAYQLTECVRDFGRMPYADLLRCLVWFMKQYATAEYVFLCDYFLPAAACRKRPETTVVQLWHSCGLMKKIAYDTRQDIPKGYRGDMFGNYTYLTLSAQACVAVHAHALRIPESRIRATGISRTDYYFDESWNSRCRTAFYKQYPQARGRRIALWAPTFRGNAGMPRLEGLEEIRQTAEALGGEWYFLIKAHPHLDARQKISNCPIPTEELLPVADLLITDYSSVLFDFLLYRKPVVLFAPDLEQYEKSRGFYLNYRELPFPLAQTAGELQRAVAKSVGTPENGSDAGTEHRLRKGAEPEFPAREEAGNGTCGDTEQEKTGICRARGDAVDRFREKYVGACDGHATERILELAGLRGSVRT